MPERIPEHDGNISWDLDRLVARDARELAQALSLSPNFQTVDPDGLRNSTGLIAIVKVFDFVLGIII